MLLEELQAIAPGFDYASCANTKGVQQNEALKAFLSKHVRNGAYIWQYLKQPPAEKAPASQPAEQLAHMQGREVPMFDADAESSDNDAGKSSFWLPAPVPWKQASAALRSMQPENADDKVFAPYHLLKKLEPDLSLAPSQQARSSPAAVAAAAEKALKSQQGPKQQLRAQYVRATVACGDCNKQRAVYCKVALRNLEQVHANRRPAASDSSSDADIEVLLSDTDECSNPSDDASEGSELQELLLQAGGGGGAAANSVDHSGSEAEAPVPTQFAGNRMTRESRRRPQRAAAIRAGAAAATAAADSAAAATEDSADSGSASADAAQTVADNDEAGPSTSKAHANIFESDSVGKLKNVSAHSQLRASDRALCMLLAPTCTMKLMQHAATVSTLVVQCCCQLAMHWRTISTATLP
jgi:hypothetical protein